jgi:hypothetical protein
MSDTITQIQARPQYIQDIDEALLMRIFGTPDASGVLQGGLIDDPELFNIPDYVQATSPLQQAVSGTFGTAEQRQEFMDRYLPYFQDAEGIAKFLPEAKSAIGTGETTISKALTDYMPNAKTYDAKTYVQEGRGSVGAKNIYDTELTKAKEQVDLSTGQFAGSEDPYALARERAETGLGEFGAREAFDGAREAFERGTGRAFELAEEGLGRFDPGARIESFMDPYKEQVIDAAMKRIDREGAQRRQQGAAKAIGAGAFGGSRAGVQAASMANAIATDEAARKRALQASGLTGQLGATGASLESSAYEDAAKRGLAGAQLETSIAGAEEKMSMEAFEAAKKRQAAAADMYRSMGLSAADAQVKAKEDEMKRSLEAGRLMGGLGQTYGALGGAQADIGKTYGALAGTSADIGRVYAGMQPADLGFMYELGGKERQYGQQGLDMLRQNQLNVTQQALAPYSYGQTFLTGSPSASMYGQFTTQPSAAPNPFISGIGAYAGLQGFNQQRA